MALDPSSFRDPSGTIFWRGKKVFRTVNPSYASHYRQLMDSGLYQKLVDEGLLVPHREGKADPDYPEAAFILEPELVPVISYPYEWCFSQLQDAAVTTLRIQQLALDHGMTLKDASAYNVQFRGGRPVFIDTLSFEPFAEQPWVAYKQFCQHFLAPLALMSYVDFRVGQLLRSHIDGVPLDLAAKMLPARTRLSPSLLMHIHMHSASQKRHASDAVTSSKQSSQPGSTLSLTAMRGLISNLESSVKRLQWRESKTEWADYYATNNNYIDEAMAAKEKLVAKFIGDIKPQSVWDLGGNTGRFSRLASDLGLETICWDIDPVAVEANYRQVRKTGESNILPLWQDLTNLSPALGWNLEERMSIMQRGPADVVMGLALIHHLAIGNNVPLSKVAELFSRLCSKGAIVEFMPKSDSQVQKLLASREDIFSMYTQEGFEAAFGQFFTIKEAKSIKGSQRALYLLMRKRQT